MKKSIVLGVVFLLSVVGLAQTMSNPLEHHGVKIFALSAPVQPYEVVETRDLGKETSEVELQSFSDRLDDLTQWKSPQPFDAIITRDGSVVQYIRMKGTENPPQGVLVNMAGKEVDVYFLSYPIKPFTVIGQKDLSEFDFSQSFISLNNAILDVKWKLAYDAVIVGVDEVRYVMYTM